MVHYTLCFAWDRTTNRSLYSPREAWETWGIQKMINRSRHLLWFKVIKFI